MSRERFEAFGVPFCRPIRQIGRRPSGRRGDYDAIEDERFGDKWSGPQMVVDRKCTPNLGAHPNVPIVNAYITMAPTIAALAAPSSFPIAAHRSRTRTFLIQFFKLA